MCLVEECNATEYAKGYCYRHWRQTREHGQITDPSPTIEGLSRLMPNEFVIEGDICRIGIRDNRGQIIDWAIVDAEDAPRCREYRWGLHDTKAGGYVTTQIKQENGKFKKTRLHKFIVQTDDLLDHRDRDTMNNRKSNLRACTRCNNAHNKGIQRNNKSGYKGVYRFSPNKWRATIGINGSGPQHIGLFDTPEEAARAYDDKARELHGEFAVLNFYEGNSGNRGRSDERSSA